MNIRSIYEKDIEEFFHLCKHIEVESQFALLEPFEKASSIEEQHKLLTSIMHHNNRAVIVAEMDEQLIGYLGVFAGDYPLNNHCARVSMGILKAYAGMGVGRKLFEKLDIWAEEHSIHRLELNVTSHNKLAINLFILQGFQYEGARHDSLKTCYGYINEFCMAKLIG